MDAPHTYRVIAEPDGRWIFLRVPELGCATEARHWHQVEWMARDLIATWLGVPPGSFEVEVVEASPEPPAP